MKSIITSYSIKKDALDAVDEIKNNFKNFKPEMILFFASSNYQPEIIGKEMKSKFADAKVFGCTTAGEIVSGQMLKNSVTVMGFSKEAVKDVKIQVIEDLQNENAVDETFSKFAKAYDVEDMHDLDFQKYVGIILIDGLSLAEERVMDRIGDLTNVLFIGGSAGDDLKFQKTHLFSEGKTYSNAAILALIEPAKGYDIIKTQSFCELDKKLKVTKADESARTVIEFNNKPAAEAYAEALGKNTDEAPNHFMANPVGLMMGDEPYVRSPQQIKDGKMVFYCNIMEGMDVSILQTQDIVEDTKKALKEKEDELDEISGIINFHCILRTLELESEDKTEEYGKIFTHIPTIGFSTYGEEYIGHINQTSTMLIIK